MKRCGCGWPFLETDESIHYYYQAWPELYIVWGQCRIGVKDSGVAKLPKNWIVV